MGVVPPLPPRVPGSPVSAGGGLAPSGGSLLGSVWGAVPLWALWAQRVRLSYVLTAQTVRLGCVLELVQSRVSGPRTSPSRRSWNSRLVRCRVFCPRPALLSWSLYFEEFHVGPTLRLPKRWLIGPAPRLVSCDYDRSLSWPPRSSGNKETDLAGRRDCR